MPCARAFFALLFVFLIGAPMTALAGPSCESLFSTVETSSRSLDQFSYGLESEYDVRAPDHPILQNYRSSFVSVHRWQTYDDSHKWRRFQGAVQKYGRWWTAISHKLGFAHLVRLPSAPSELPERLSIEAHGTVEVSGIVRPDVDEIEHLYFDDLTKTFGPGAIQGHVVWPKAWHRGGGLSLAGYTLFEGDHATLSALEQGYARYLSNPGKIPAAFLIHYALGPHSEGAKKFLIEADAKLAAGQRIGSGSFFRMVNGPAPRDDVYPEDKVGIELRQFSYRPWELFREMRRLADLVASGRVDDFKFYLEADALSDDLVLQAPLAGAKLSVKLWTDFFAGVGRHLRAHSSFPITGGSTFQKRFLLPFRNWEENPVVKRLSTHEQTAACERIAQARSRYVQDVEELMTKNLPEADAIIRLRIAIARWANEAKLSDYFN